MSFEKTKSTNIDVMKKSADSIQSDKKSKKHAPVYRLGNRLICPAQNGWNLDEMWDDGMHHFWGRVWLRDGFLWLSGWKVHGSSTFDSVEERAAELAATPPWPLSLARWAVYCGGNLIDCRTGEYADENDPEAKAALLEVDRLRAESDARHDRWVLKGMPKSPLRNKGKMLLPEKTDSPPEIDRREQQLRVLRWLARVMAVEYSERDMAEQLHGLCKSEIAIRLLILRLEREVAREWGDLSKKRRAAKENS